MEYVSRYQSAGSLLASAFILGAAVLFGSLFLVPTAVHAAAPTMQATTITADTNTDGTIDRITVFFSEATDLDDTGGAADGFTSLAFNSGCTIVNGDYTGAGVLSKAFTVTGCTSEDTSITPTATYTAVASCATNFSICDDAEANQMANGANRQAADGAGPVLISSSPTSLKTGVRSTASVTLTFSETPASITTSHSPTVVLTSSINSSVVTLTHAAAFLTGLNTLTISTAPDAAANAFAGAQAGDSTVASPLTFYVSSSSGGDEETEVTYGVNLLSPEVDDSFEAGTTTDITWESEGGQASYVNLYYSEDAGDTWETIVTNTLNDGSYSWTTPHIDSDEVMVKVVTTDLALELATDTSASFSLWFYDEDEDGTSDDETTDDEVVDDEEEVTEIDGIMAGDYIKVSGGSTIYFVDEDMTRRPFFDEQTYFTYEDDFDAVVEVSDETLAEFVMGAPMMPKAGVVLVKIQSVAKVYLVEEVADGSYELRWVTSEDIAEEMFGANWSSYVVDVDVTLFSRYEEGEDVEDAYEVDTEDMKLGSELHD